jgi:glycine cleavage system regulatory protein
MIDAELLDAIERATENAIAEIAALRAALSGREAEIEALTSICDERQEVIDTLQGASEERLALIEQLTQEAERLSLEIERLTEQTAVAAVTQTDGVDWQAIAIERGQALELVSVEAERRAALLAELTSALQARTAEVEELRRDRARSS